VAVGPAIDDVVRPRRSIFVGSRVTGGTRRTGQTAQVGVADAAGGAPQLLDVAIARPIDNYSSGVISSS